MLPCAFTVSLWPSMRACDTRLTSITFCSIILPSLVVPLFFMPYFLLSFHVLEKTSTTCFLGTDKFHLLSYRTYFPKSSMIPFFLVVGRNPIVREWMNAMPLDIYSTFSVGKPPEWLYVLVFVSKWSHKKTGLCIPLYREMTDYFGCVPRSAMAELCGKSIPDWGRKLHTHFLNGWFAFATSSEHRTI